MLMSIGQMNRLMHNPIFRSTKAKKVAIQVKFKLEHVKEVTSYVTEGATCGGYNIKLLCLAKVD